MRDVNSILLLVHHNAKHDFFAEFNATLMDGLQDLGIRVDVSDFSEAQEKWAAYAAAILKHEYDAVLVLNSWGEHNITLDNGINLYDRAGVPFYNWIVDHPAEHNGHLQTNCRNYHMICIDRDHVRFLKKYYPDIVSASFLPLPVKYTDNINLNYDDFEKRSKDVVFAGNCPDIKHMEEVFLAQPEAQKDLLFFLAEYLMTHQEKSYEKALEEVLISVFEGEPAREEFQEYVKLTTPVVPYVRALSREKVIRSLMESDIKLHIYGTGWEEYHQEIANGNTILEGKADFRQLTDIYHDSKIVLNIMPWFKDGMHDRILKGMFSGAAVLTDHTAYLDEIASDDNIRSFLLFDISRPKLLSEIIKQELSCIGSLYETAQNGWKLARDRFGYENIAGQLIQIIKDTGSAI